MNTKKAKAIRRIMELHGLKRDDPKLQLQWERFDTGRKYYDEKAQGFKILYRYQLCNPYKRAFRALAKGLDR